MKCVCWSDSSKARMKGREAMVEQPQLPSQGNDSAWSINNGTLDFTISRRDDGEDDIEGVPISCPYEPPAMDSYCSGGDLSKRANSAKEISLPWISKMKWSNYAACPGTGSAGITNVPRVSQAFESMKYLYAAL